MERLNRKKRTYKEIGYKTSGGMFDLFDNAIKEAYRINDEEYDYIAESLTDEEASIFTKEQLSFIEKRQIILMLDKYLNDFYIKKHE